MFSDPQSNINQFMLAPGMRVADFGSGSGFYSLAAAKIVGDTGRVFAIDIQKDLLQKLKTGALQEHLHNIELMWGDLEHLGGTKLRESSIDAAIIANIFFQIENKESLCLEAKRVLKPKAKVMVIDWGGSYGGVGPMEKDVVSKLKMADLFQSHGFELEREISAGAHHYGLIFRKVK
ncbi:MAG: methyltransferase domain-containing protein [bacterium]